jgi:hypothetical protein
VLVVTLRVKLEVRSLGRAVREAVVLDEAAELRQRDLRLAGFDRVQDRGRAELVVGGRPGCGAATGLGKRLMGLVDGERGRKVVPERDVRSLLVGVQLRGAGGAQQRVCGSGSRSSAPTAEANSSQSAMCSASSSACSPAVFAARASATTACRYSPA